MTDASAASSIPPLTRETRIVVAGDQVSADLEGETVILSMSHGAYYGLDKVGSRIWGLFAAPTALGDVLSVILAEFEVAEDRAWEDLRALVTDLLAQELVVIAPDTTG